jgi:hypothetical protein
MTGRRAFLKEALITGTAAALAKPATAATSSAQAAVARPAASKPSPALAAAGTRAPSLDEAPAADTAHIGNSGSDFMVDLLRVAGI